VTLTAHLTIKEDGQILHEDEAEFEDDDTVWLDIQNWLVAAGTVGRDAYYGPPPKPMDKLPRDAWDKELQ
jgi:hypothetical protein